MTIEFKTGNILDFTENLCLQQVNHQKVMGAGLAKQIRNKWPKIYDEYCRFIDDNRDWKELKFKGRCHYFSIVGFSKYIVNIFGQQYYGNDKNYTDYNALLYAFYSIRERALDDNFSIAVPYKLASGLSGGSWEIVYKNLEKVFGESEVKVVIYKLEGVEQ